MRLALSLALAGPLLAGCADKLLYDTPYLETHVVNAATGKPIAHVQVTVWTRRSPGLVAHGESDAHGAVLVQPLTHRESMFGPFDPAPPDGSARFEAPEYAPREVAIDWGISETPTVALDPLP